MQIALRLAGKQLGHLFPYIPKQPGYNKRLRALAPQICEVINHLARISPSFCERLRLLDRPRCRAAPRAKRSRVSSRSNCTAATSRKVSGRHCDSLDPALCTPQLAIECAHEDAPRCLPTRACLSGRPGDCEMFRGGSVLDEVKLGWRGRMAGVCVSSCPFLCVLDPTGQPRSCWFILCGRVRTTRRSAGR